jgi:hypothetical protein
VRDGEPWSEMDVFDVSENTNIANEPHRSDFREEAPGIGARGYNGGSNLDCVSMQLNFFANIAGPPVVTLAIVA